MDTRWNTTFFLWCAAYSMFDGQTPKSVEWCACQVLLQFQVKAGSGQFNVKENIRISLTKKIKFSFDKTSIQIILSPRP